jgi:hypothetical protein
MSPDYAFAFFKIIYYAAPKALKGFGVLCFSINRSLLTELKINPF